MRVLRPYTGFSLVLSFAALLAQNPLRGAGNTWSPTGSLNEARTGSAAVLLSDGRILLTGGSDTAGPLASTEFFTKTGGC